MTADAARAQLDLSAHLLLQEAADKHAEGMSLARQAARLEQLVSILTDEQVVQVLERLVLEGVVEIVEVTSPGGDA